MGNIRKLRVACLASAGAAALVAVPVSAQVKRFSIPAQSAQSAIGALGRQGDIQIVAARKVTRSRKVNAVKGDMTAAVALDRMLRGTGLTARRTAPQTFVVLPAANGDGGGQEQTPSPRPGAAPSTSAAGDAANVNAPSAPADSDVPTPQTQDVAEEQAADIVVTGLRNSLDSARGIKRSASGIVDAISTQDIGKLPDTNLAESLQRVTGVSIDRSGGEGAFITVRGFGPEFNAVLINGRQIATPTDPSQASGRAFSFDTLASELVAGVEVYKSSTARLQSGGVGSTVNIKTARPFDFKGARFAATADVNYDGNAEKASPDASFLFSDTFGDDRFGVLLSGSYQRRFTRLNQAVTDGWLVNPSVPAAQVNGGRGTTTADNPQGNIFIPQNFDSRVTREERERIGATLALQFRPVDNLTITADALYARFDNKTDARSYGHWFTASNLTGVTTNANGTAVDMTQSVGMATDFHDKKFDKKTDTRQFGLNADWAVTPNLSLVLDGTYSTSKQDPNGGKQAYLTLLGYLTGSARYQADGKDLPIVVETNPRFASATNPCGSAVTDSGVPRTGGVVGEGNPLCQHVMLLRGFGIKDRVGQVRADLNYKGDDTQGLTGASAGLYYSNNRKRTSLFSNDGGTGCTTCGYNLPIPPGVQSSVFNAGNGFLSGLSGSGRLPKQWQTFSGPALFDAITAQQRATNPNFTFAPPLVNDTIVTEEVLGGYVEAELRGALGSGTFSLVAGARLENTSTDINGLATAYTALVRLANDQTQYGSEASGTTRTTGTNNYLDILPNLAFRWQITDNFIARLAASQTITRPTLEQLSPVTTLLTLRPGNFAAASGNADLEPFKSNNLDISAEYYFGQTNYISIGGYLKNVSNFIVLNQTTGTVPNAAGTPLLDPATGTPAQFAITAPVNGQNATVYGIEAAWQQALGDTGFGYQINGTLVDSNRKLDRQDLTNKFALTGLSNSANAVLFYDKNGIEARVAYNWRDKFLQYLAPPPLNGAGQAVTQVRSYSQVDASVTYRFTPAFAVFAEGVNLTRSFIRKYAYGVDQFLLAEDAGRRFKVGARVNF